MHGLVHLSTSDRSAQTRQCLSRAHIHAPFPSDRPRNAHQPAKGKRPKAPAAAGRKPVRAWPPAIQPLRPQPPPQAARSRCGSHGQISLLRIPALSPNLYYAVQQNRAPAGLAVSPPQNSRVLTTKSQPPSRFGQIAGFCVSALTPIAISPGADCAKTCCAAACHGRTAQLASLRLRRGDSKGRKEVLPGTTVLKPASAAVSRPRSLQFSRP